MSEQTLGYAEAHDTSIEERYSAVPLLKGKVIVVSEQNPGIANWLETTGHRTGSMMLRWQRLTRDLTQDDDGPTLQVVPFADVQQHLLHFAPITPEEYAARIAARQRSVARRMIS